MRRAVIRDMGFKRLSTGQSAFLERPITLDEVHEAVWDCDRAKSPGPDGFNFRFYRKVRHLICHDLFSLVNEFFRTERMPRGVNHSYVALIAKKLEATTSSDFRPISMVSGGIYKILSKILSNRLKGVMQDLISDNQTAFIAGRQIVDGYMIANEVIHSLKLIIRPLMYDF